MMMKIVFWNFCSTCVCVCVCVCLRWVCASACWLGHDAEDVSFIYSKVSLKGTDIGHRIKRTWWRTGFRQWGNWNELRINHRFLAWLTGWRVLPFPEIGNAVRELVREDSVQFGYVESEASVRHPSGDILKAVTGVWAAEKGLTWQYRYWVHWQKDGGWGHQNRLRQNTQYDGSKAIREFWKGSGFKG